MDVIPRQHSIWFLLIISISVGLLFSACSTLTMVADEPEQQAGVRTQMEATDPETVSLAAGQPQLVEFFAFW
jgi:hypothetical protein